MVNNTDAMLRYQVFLEGYKEYQSARFNDILVGLRASIKYNLAQIESANLGDVTKNNIEKIISAIRLAQIAHYDVHAQQMLLELQDFIVTNQDIHATIFDNDSSDEEQKKELLLLFTPLSRKKLWSAIQLSVIPAYGASFETILPNLSEVSGQLIKGKILQFYAENQTVAALVTALTGSTNLNGRDGIVNRLYTQARGATHTLIQQAATQSMLPVAQIYYDKYRWVSVIDGVTSKICRNRSDRVYAFGEGPLPPAHPNCRSHIEPHDKLSKPVPTSYYAWLKQQPRKVQEAIVGMNAAKDLSLGHKRSEDFSRFTAKYPLDLKQLKKKIILITQ